MSFTACPTCGDDDQPDIPRHAGYRYLVWSFYTQPRLTADQKAKGYEKFAAEFESLPADEEPYPGWAKTLASLLRRIALHHRDEPLPERRRTRAGGDGSVAPLRAVS